MLQTQRVLENARRIRLFASVSPSEAFCVTAIYLMAEYPQRQIDVPVTPSVVNQRQSLGEEE